MTTILPFHIWMGIHEWLYSEFEVSLRYVLRNNSLYQFLEILLYEINLQAASWRAIPQTFIKAVIKAVLNSRF